MSWALTDLRPPQTMPINLLLGIALLCVGSQDAPGSGAATSRLRAAATLRSALEEDRVLDETQVGLTNLLSAGQTASKQLGDSVLARALLKSTSDARWRELFDAREARRSLVRELKALRADLEFEPQVEAELPVGFPGLTPVGEIELKLYPHYRMVRADMSGSGSQSAFWKLFKHIQAGEIAMTAPVEMAWSDADREASMAFLYGSTEIGTPGPNGELEVLDIKPLAAISLGCRGDATRAGVAAARVELQRWLEARGDLVVAGELRTLGYNSPMVARERRYFEVQLPVQRMEQASDRRVILDFSDPRETQRWQPLDDSVMGGVSASRLERSASGASCFVGNMSLENNGGFASVRAPLSEGVLKNTQTLVLTCRGDGKSYKLRLRSSGSSDGVNYEARFQTEAGALTEHRFALTDFVPVWRGRRVPDARPLDAASVQSIGLMISDGQAGSFRLELRSLAAL
jgi:NADH dehydrogenase [ubiquinone] 1 alpha subcomplex assembly factor 1